MRTIALSNQKGGSGKTTTAVNLAACLAELGRRVLLVDLDAQASATNWFAQPSAERGLLEVFTGERRLPDLVRPTGTPGVELVPASPWLASVDKALAGELGAELILQREVRRLPADRWEYLLLDCPPTLGVVTVNALAAVREVLVPVEAHVMALNGLAQILQTMQVVRERLNPDLGVAAIVACRVDGRTRHAREVVEQLRSRFGEAMCTTVIRESVRLAESPSFGQPIITYDGRSGAAADYRALAQELVHQERSR